MLLWSVLMRQLWDGNFNCNKQLSAFSKKKAKFSKLLKLKARIYF